MKLNLYTLRRKAASKTAFDWFYVIKDTSIEFKIPEDASKNLYHADYNSKSWNLDFNTPLSFSEATQKIHMEIEKGDFNIRSYYCPIYITHSIHGHCYCDLVLNELKKEDISYLNIINSNQYSLLKKKQLYCKCYEYGPLINGWYRDRKEFKFPTGFQRVIYVKELDFFNIGVRSHYVICSLNVMDVHQVQPNVYDVGIDYTFETDLYMHLKYGYKDFASDLYKVINFDDDMVAYEQKIKNLINLWTQSGLLPKTVLFKYVYESFNMDPRDIYYRHYVKESDFNECLLSKKKIKTL